MQAGAIVDVDEAGDAIAQAVERAERWPASASRASPSATAGGPARELRRHRPGLARRPADRRRGPDPRHRRRPWPGPLARPPRHPRAADRLVGRRPARRARPALHVRPPAGPGPAGGLHGRRRVPDPRPLRRARAPAVRRRGRRAVRLGAGRAGGGRDGPRLHLHRHGRRLDLGGGVRRRLAGPRRQPGGRRRARHPGHRARPLDLDRRRRADQDPARLGHRLGQRGPRDDRGAAARRRPGRRVRWSRRARS